MKEVKEEIEILRAELNKLTAEEDYYDNEIVLKISQELDKTINKYLEIKYD